MSAIEHKGSYARFGAHGLVLIGFSAGGLATLQTLLPELRNAVRAPIVIAHHVSRSILPELIRVWTPGRAAFARAGETLRADRVYVAPPGRHLIINPDATFSLSARDRINYVMPSIDWLFESGAASFRDRTVAVVLSGGQRDGSRGARCVRRSGGVVVAQDPLTAIQPSMPQAAILAGADRVAAPDQLAGTIAGALRGLDLAAAADNWRQPFDKRGARNAPGQSGTLDRLYVVS